MKPYVQISAQRRITECKKELDIFTALIENYLVENCVQYKKSCEQCVLPAKDELLVAQNEKFLQMYYFLNIIEKNMLSTINRYGFASQSDMDILREIIKIDLLYVKAISTKYFSDLVKYPTIVSFFLARAHQNAPLMKQKLPVGYVDLIEKAFVVKKEYETKIKKIQSRVENYFVFAEHESISDEIFGLSEQLLVVKNFNKMALDYLKSLKVFVGGGFQPTNSPTTLSLTSEESAPAVIFSPRPELNVYANNFSPRENMRPTWHSPRYQY